jgi:hypothetical protein
MKEAFWWHEFSRTGSIDAYIAMKRSERLDYGTERPSENEGDSNKRD